MELSTIRPLRQRLDMLWYNDNRENTEYLDRSDSNQYTFLPLRDENRE